MCLIYQVDYLTKFMTNPNGAGERPEINDINVSDKTKYKDFEDYLKEEHAEDYGGLDDDMPDNFDKWLQNLDVDEWLVYGQKFAKIYKNN